MRFGNGLPRVALADSLTRCYSLKPLRGFGELARALAAETLTPERTLSDLVNQTYALNPAEIEIMWQTAPPRMPIPPPFPASGIPVKGSMSMSCLHRKFEAARVPLRIEAHPTNPPVPLRR